MIGLIGGLSWKSAAYYYRLINEIVRDRLGGLHSARLIIWSFDFDDIARLQAGDDWEGSTLKMIEAGHALGRTGAQAIAICSNTMHKMADDVRTYAQLPVIHIADAVANALHAAQ